MTDEDRECGSAELRPQKFPCLVQLRIGLGSYGAVVRPRSAASAAAQRLSLRRECHNRQLAAHLGQFSTSSQRCSATAT